MKVMRQYTSIFTETGDNMNLKPNAMRERAEFSAQAPWWVRNSAPLINKAYQTSRFFQGGFFEKPLSYSIYTLASPEKRVTFDVANPKARWNRVPLKSGS
jgi:hypothetical protein